MDYYRVNMMKTTELLQIVSDTKDMDGPLKKLNQSARNELSLRESNATTELWEARSKVQQIENEIRQIRGWPMIQLGGLTGDVEQ